MAMLEIRRHAERGDRGNEQAALSVAGRAMAESLAKRLPKYAIVLSSPLPRPKDSARRRGVRLLRGCRDHIREGDANEDRGRSGLVIRPRSTRGVWCQTMRRRPAFRSSDRAPTAPP